MLNHQVLYIKKVMIEIIFNFEDFFFQKCILKGVKLCKLQEWNYQLQGSVTFAEISEVAILKMFHHSGNAGCPVVS